jgi:hypothetical protein
MSSPPLQPGAALGPQGSGERVAGSGGQSWLPESVSPGYFGISFTGQPERPMPAHVMRQAAEIAQHPNTVRASLNTVGHMLGQATTGAAGANVESYARAVGDPSGIMNEVNSTLREGYGVVTKPVARFIVENVMRRKKLANLAGKVVQIAMPKVFPKPQPEPAAGAGGELFPRSSPKPPPPELTGGGGKRRSRRRRSRRRRSQRRR